MKRTDFERINLGRPFVDEQGWTVVNVYSMSGRRVWGRIRLNAEEGLSEVVDIMQILEQWSEDRREA